MGVSFGRCLVAWFQADGRGSGSIAMESRAAGASWKKKPAAKPKNPLVITRSETAGVCNWEMFFPRFGKWIPQFRLSR